MFLPYFLYSRFNINLISRLYHLVLEASLVLAKDYDQFPIKTRGDQRAGCP